MDGSTNASNVGGTVGSDTKPIKIVNGQAVAVASDLIVSGGNTNYKWALKTGYATMRFQSNTVNYVDINVGMTIASYNNLFPMVTLTYNGNGWANISLNISNRTTTGFRINSYVTTSGIDVTGDVFWMALIPVAP